MEYDDPERNLQGEDSNSENAVSSENPNPPTQATAGLENQDERTDNDLLTPDQEILELLKQDDTRLGQVFNLSVLQNLSSNEVADKLQVDTSGFVSNYLTCIRAITGESFTKSPSLARQASSRISSLIRKNKGSLSREALQLLKDRQAKLTAVVTESAASNSASDEPEEEQFQEMSDADMNRLNQVPGIYAFSYGWYLENPEHRDFGEDATMLKVGKAMNLKARMEQHMQNARTMLPEPVVLVRAYRVSPDTLDTVEKTFHRLLSTAGHENRRTKMIGKRSETGKEWFLTNSDFLDAIADTLGLSTVWIGSSEFADKEYD